METNFRSSFHQNWFQQVFASQFIKLRGTPTAALVQSVVCTDNIK